MSVVRTEDKYLCDACGEEYIGPPTLYENHQKTDMRRMIRIAVFDYDDNRRIGRKLDLCPDCSDAILNMVVIMGPKKPKRKWWKKEVVG